MTRQRYTEIEHLRREGNNNPFANEAERVDYECERRSIIDSLGHPSYAMACHAVDIQRKVDRE